MNKAEAIMQKIRELKTQKEKKSSSLSWPKVRFGYKVLPTSFSFVHALACKHGWPVLSLTVSSSHRQCIAGVLISAEFAMGSVGVKITTQISALLSYPCV